MMMKHVYLCIFLQIKPISFIFTPIEAKDYEFRCILKYNRCGIIYEENINVRGQGFAPSTEDRSIHVRYIEYIYHCMCIVVFIMDEIRRYNPNGTHHHYYCQRGKKKSCQAN